MVIDGIFFRTRTGCPWRDLPDGLGNWKTVYNRHRHWSGDGTWEQILDRLRADMKQVIDLRPVFHRREDRIRAHVILCWLALLLARIAGNACGRTWPELRRELDKIHVGTFTGPAGTFRQRTELTKNQRDILKTLKIDAPPRIYQLKLPTKP